MNVFVDYKCNKCEYTEEKYIENYGAKNQAWPVFRCPECSGGMMQRVISAVRSVFKGKDFPTNDLRKK